ncbi:MAG TPA: SDR family NAD(P)-dependent oxidoreductase [Sphingobium sp.]|nr:SDR family NAD(P)-dependent oxidoreductase [Sphingobium sp.]
MLDAGRYGPWALVAGASEGIGLAFVKAIAAAGINIVMVARRAELLAASAEEVRAETGVEVRTLQAELAEPGIVDRLRAVTDDIEVGLLVFNAAAANFKPFLDQNEEELLAAIRLSCTAQSLIVQHYARLMAPRGHGGILLVSSLAGCAGIPNMAAYSGAKAYTQLFGEALWAELKPQGVDVFVQVVGSTDTPRRRASGAGAVPGIPVLTPEAVVTHALTNIADGPVQVAPPLQPMFDKICTARRADAVQLQRADIKVSDRIF